VPVEIGAVEAVATKPRLWRGFALLTLLAVVASFVAITTTRAGGGSPETWRVLPKPATPTLDGPAVWTGHEMLVWGDVSDGEATSVAYGAAYSPDTNAWRTLPPAPISGRGGNSAVWTGTEMVVWGGSETVVTPTGANSSWHETQLRGDGAAYNPASNSWRLLAPSPLAPRIGHFGVWTGTEMMVWGGDERNKIDSENRPDTGRASDGAMYDPRTDTWRPVSPSPLAGEEDSYGRSTWTGKTALFWVGTAESTRVTDGWSSDLYYDHVARGVQYDPSHDTWEMIPGSTVAYVPPVWTGHELIVVHLRREGAPRSGGRPIEDGAFDPTSRSWRPIAHGPHRGEGFMGYVGIWTGTEALLWGPDPKAYNPLTDRWRRIAEPPLDCRDGAAVWTGRELLIWGGAHGGAYYAGFNDGLAYHPPGAPPSPDSSATTAPERVRPVTPQELDETMGQGYADYRCGGPNRKHSR
jgi:hypothetical protein